MPSATAPAACGIRRDPPRAHSLALGELSHLSTVDSGVSNSIQIQNSRRPKVTMLGALPIYENPAKRPVCLRTKDPSPKCWGFCYAAFNLILTARARHRGAGFTSRPSIDHFERRLDANSVLRSSRALGSSDRVEFT